MGTTLKTIGLHILFWIFIVIYFVWGFGLDAGPERAIRSTIYFLPGHILMVYTVLYYLVPKFLLARKYWRFFLGFIILVVICGQFTSLAQLTISGDPRHSGASITVGRNILPYIHVVAIAASIKLLKYWFIQRKQTLEAEQQRTVAELKLLKAQLHPHFLFNTLNNLYSHTLEFSPKSPEIVLKLSALLRFMIYESNSQRISLSRELELLLDYISLEKLRYGDRLDLSINITGDIEKYQIVPLLLLPFLENAFKHGTSKQIDQCWISFDLSLDGSQMKFKLINSIDPDNKPNHTQPGGLGMENVKKRLEILYRGKYNLETRKLAEVYVVNLELQLEILEEQYIDRLQLAKTM